MVCMCGVCVCQCVFVGVGVWEISRLRNAISSAVPDLAPPPATTYCGLLLGKTLACQAIQAQPAVGGCKAAEQGSKAVPAITPPSEARGHLLRAMLLLALYSFCGRPC